MKIKKKKIISMLEQDLILRDWIKQLGLEAFNIILRRDNRIRPKTGILIKYINSRRRDIFFHSNILKSKKKFEETIIHELLHIKYPKNSEGRITEKTFGILCGKYPNDRVKEVIVDSKYQKGKKIGEID